MLAILATRAVAAGPTPTLAPAERGAVFKAAGFKAVGDRFVRCEEETPMASSRPGAIEVTDLNGDGRPEAFVTESSLFCYGATESLVVLLTKDADGSWRKLIDEPGVHLVRETKHEGWLDVEVGGPGLGTQPVYRWNGKTYVRGR